MPDTGIAGFQRQMRISPDTGWVGQATFNALASARVPDVFPHGGEMAMDAYAVSLLEQAFNTFGGDPAPAPTPPTPPQPGKLTRKAIPSPNYSSRGGASVRLIVLHTAEGSTSIESLGSYFQNPAAEASSHVGIDDKAGVVGEYVQRSGKAWTAANANPVSVQAELCGFAKWTAAEWAKHPNMLENCARWIAEEAAAFGLPLTRLNASQAQGSGRGVCEHVDLGSWGGGHWDCGGGFPIGDVLARAKEIS